MARKDYIDKINKNMEKLTKDELKDVATLTNVQFGVRFKVAEKEYWEKEVEAIKSQLQQQSLPVVPECVAKDVKRLSLSTLADWNVAVSYISKETLEWLSTTGNINVFLGKSWALCSLKINGFTVEKTKLFYLREKNTNYYLNKSKNNGLELVPNPYFDEDNQFTKQEIDSMQTGSYEQIEVTE